MLSQNIPQLEVQAPASHNGRLGKGSLAVGLAVNAGLMLMGVAVWGTYTHGSSTSKPSHNVQAVAKFDAFAPAAMPFSKSRGEGPAPLEGRQAPTSFRLGPRPSVSVNRRAPHMSASDVAEETKTAEQISIPQYGTGGGKLPEEDTKSGETESAADAEAKSAADAVDKAAGDAEKPLAEAQTSKTVEEADAAVAKGPEIPPASPAPPTPTPAEAKATAAEAAAEAARKAVEEMEAAEAKAAAMQAMIAKQGQELSLPPKAANAGVAAQEAAKEGVKQESKPAAAKDDSKDTDSGSMSDALKKKAEAALANVINEDGKTASQLMGKIAGDKSMATVALKALESFTGMEVVNEVRNMPAADQKKFEEMQVDVVAKAKTLPGISAPLGFFDPVGFCSQVSEGRLCFFREVELKHGRVAMLASIGFVVAELFHPMFGGEIDVPSYIAFQETPLQTFWPAVVAAIAIPETFSIFSFREPWATTYFKGGQLGTGMWTVKTDREGGDFGFDPLNLKPKNKEDFKIMQTKELNNGRLAMIAAAGMIAQELVTGETLPVVDAIMEATGLGQ